MPLLPILEIPHPTLRMRAKKIRSIDKKALRLAYDMVDTMRDAGGVGLAANQVGELVRIIVLQMPDEEEARIYFNPEVTKSEGIREVEEGCLSLPGLRGIVERSIWIKFQGLDHCQKLVKFKAEDLLSQAIEHEIDHLNGILYPDHLVAHTRLYKIDETQEHTESNKNLHVDQAQNIDDSDDTRNSPASAKIK